MYQAIACPHPKYPLTRYTTRQLLSWFEEVTYARAIARHERRFCINEKDNDVPADVIRKHHDTTLRGARLEYQLKEVLGERGVDYDCLYRIAKHANADVLS